MSEKHWMRKLIGTGIVIGAGVAVTAYLTKKYLSTETDENESVFLDLDGDNTADIEKQPDLNVVAADTTGDGKIDTVLADTTGDGNIDTVLVDTTGDGEANVIFTEADDVPEPSERPESASEETAESPEESATSEE